VISRRVQKCSNPNLDVSLESVHMLPGAFDHASWSTGSAPELREGTSGTPPLRRGRGWLARGKITFWCFRTSSFKTIRTTSRAWTTQNK
jgi:hypothetical protein